MIDPGLYVSFFLLSQLLEAMLDHMLISNPLSQLLEAVFDHIGILVSWHKFILGKIWGIIRGLGEVFSTIFGFFIVGRVIWYLIKVAMNCVYIHGAHGCSPQLAWSFCMEVLFTHHYRKSQHQQQAAESGWSDNDPSGHSCKRRTICEYVMSITSCSCLNPCQLSDSDEDIPEARAAREETNRFPEDSWPRLEARVVTAQRARSALTPYGTLNRASPPYATPMGVTPMASVMPTPDSETGTTSERTTLNVDPAGQPLSNV